MGFRFRKSIKIAPGIKVNFGRKSVGMSVGGKYGGFSLNSKTGTRARISIPGTGLSYSTKISGSGRIKKKTPSSSKSKIRTSSLNLTPVCLRWWYIALIVLFAIAGLSSIGTSASTSIIAFVIALIMGLFTLKESKKSKNVQPADNGELLELQKVVLKDSPDELIMSEIQLKATAAQMAENSYRIMNDCSNLLQTSVNPSVFFERLQLFTTHCQTLVALEKYINFSGASPTELYNTLLKERQEVIREFLVRYLCKVDAKADSLKTAKGKQNQYQKFYDSLKPYFSEMDADNIEYIEANTRRTQLEPREEQT